LAEKSGEVDVALGEFGRWLLVLHSVIDAEYPNYDRNPDRWRRYFNGDYTPREALEADMMASRATREA
jgi:hypothetical protein